jgi:hypothetical protein
MRHSPSIIPASQVRIHQTTWNCSWMTSKENGCILSQEDLFFKKWIFTFFYKKQKRIFSSVTGTTKKKNYFSFLKVTKRNTSHFINILKIRKKVTTKAMNWVVHNIYITRFFKRTNIYVYLSCWMASDSWVCAQTSCSKWFTSQCQQRFSVINNQILCKIIWVYPSKNKFIKKTNNFLHRMYLMKNLFFTKLTKILIRKRSNYTIPNNNILKNKYLNLLNETIYS